MTPSKEEQDMAHLYEQKLKECINDIKLNVVKFALLMKYIKETESFKIMMGSEITFDVFTQHPDYYIGYKSATINQYIKDVEDMERKGLIETDYANLTMNKIHLIKSAKNPKKWIGAAESLGFSDLKKEFYEKEKGVKLDDNDVENYIKREQNKHICCPFWNEKEGQCQKESQSK